MPDLGTFHPQVVHFVIALLLVGVLLRLISFTGRAAFTGPAASTLILVGTAAAVLAVFTGDKAHSVPERVPGARDAVVEHEEWGERTRNIFLVVALLEIGALAAARRAEQRASLTKGLRIAGAVVGLAGLASLYETAEHGGDLVYRYAGGIGIRSGDPADIERLLVAGLYHSAIQQREANRPSEAARLFGELARLRPSDTEVALLRAESMILDRNDPLGALDTLGRISIEGLPERLRVRRDLLRVDAYEKLGARDSSRVVLDALGKEFPANVRVRARADSLR
jgi:uncharacterized membrane protein